MEIMNLEGDFSTRTSRNGRARLDYFSKVKRKEGWSELRLCKTVKSAVKQCFSAVEPRGVYSTNELLPATNKDVLPALQKSNVIYQFSCHCNCRYVGRTSQRLQDRIKQHVPKSIRSCSSSQKRFLPARRCKSSTQTNTQSLASDLAIGLYLLQNPTCAQHYDDSRFSILAQGRSPFHLSALEATFIKTSNPALCRQKEFLYSLKIVHYWRFLIDPFPANHGSAFSYN